MTLKENILKLSGLLNENKDHLIDKIELTAEQKNAIKKFFKKYPNLENKVDWNRKNLTFEDFKPLLDNAGKSKTQAKKNGIPGLKAGHDYIILDKGNDEEIGNWIAYQPLTYLGSKTLASNAVPPVKENGAKWCISYQKDSSYWKNYSQKDRFIFLFTDSTKYAFEVPLSNPMSYNIWNFEDEKMKATKWAKRFEYLFSSLQKELPQIPFEEKLKKYGLVLKNGLVYNPDGKNINISDFIKDGKFICKFGEWKGGFDCSEHNLISLQGAPEKVGGSFYCNNNKLTSLQGAPKEVGWNFDCSHNSLTSLQGAPKEVSVGFDCSHNSLTSLQGAPEKVGKYFYCSNNKLTSLQGAPKEVNEDFDCRYNSLTSLQGAPEKVSGGFFCHGNPDYPFKEWSNKYNIA